MFLILLAILDIGRGTLIDTPKSKFSKGTEIYMPCKSDKGYNLKWYIQKNDSKEEQELWSGYKMLKDAESYCEVIHEEKGNYTLKLESRREAGQGYICFEPGTLQRARAELIFVESGLQCVDNSTEDFVNLTCSIEFSGNWAPSMKWNETCFYSNRIHTQGVNTTVVPNRYVTSRLILSTISIQNDCNYTCITYFDISGKPLQTTATNVPTYEHIWIYQPIMKPAAGSKGKELWSLVLIPLVVVVVIIVAAILVYRNKRRRQETHRIEEAVADKLCEKS